MFDWKIIAAAFVALLFVASMLAGNLGVKEFFSGAVGKVGDWLGSSPLGGFFSSSSKSTEGIDIVLFPESISLSPDSGFNMSMGSTKMNGLSGILELDFRSETAKFQEKNSPLSFSLPLKESVLTGLSFSKLVVENVGITVLSGSWNITTSNGTVELYDFTGRGIVSGDGLELIGNVSKLVRL